MTYYPEYRGGPDECPRCWPVKLEDGKCPQCGYGTETEE